MNTLGNRSTVRVVTLTTEELLAQVHLLSTEELLAQADLIKENLAECGSPSNYATRNRPLLRKIQAELRTRGKREQ